jgi:hypothetical protein
MKKIFGFIFFVILLASCKSPEKEHNFDPIIIEENQTIVEENVYKIPRTHMRIYIDPLYKRSSDQYVHDLNWINENEYYIVERIYFDVYDIDKIDFSPLFTLNNLREISISCYDDSFTDFPDLSGVKNLKELEIYDSSISSFDNIRKNIPDIEKIYMCNDIKNNSKIVNLRGLSEINSLKELFLNDLENDYNFLDLYGLSNLESFKAYTTGFIDFNGIERLISLKFIDVHRCKPENINHLGSVETLQTLILGIDRRVNNFKFLENLINLEYIGLYNIEYNYYAGALDGKKEYQKEIDMRLMKNLITLKGIDLGGFIIDNIIVLNELPLLKEVGLCDCFVLPNNDHKIIIDNDTWVRRDFTPDGK